MIVIFFYGFSIVIKSDNLAMISRNGSMQFTTTDTKATSGIRWKTVGFTITRQRCLTGPYANGGNPLKLDHAVIMLSNEWKREVDYGDVIKVTFTIPQSAVSSALIKAGFEDIKNEDSLYLHGIFQVTHNGKDFGSKKYDLPSIMKTESWANPDDFEDRFDIKVYYNAPDEPISIQYKTSSGDILQTTELPQTKWKKTGEKVAVTLDDEKLYQGKRYKLYKSYIRNYMTQATIQGYGKNTLTGDSYESVKNRTIQQKVGGVQFVAIMKPVTQPKPEKIDELESNWNEPVPYGVIAADKREHPQFQSETGIPATESLYLNIFSSTYLLSYEFKKIEGKKNYSVTFTKTYHLSWTEKGKQQSSVETRTKTISVQREYSYWELAKADYYIIKDATIQNRALPEGKCVISPNNYRPPNLQYQEYPSAEHLKKPDYELVQDLGVQSISGGNSKPSVPEENFQSIAEQRIGDIKVRNDAMKLGEVVISSSSWCQKQTTKPMIIEQEEEINSEVLFREGLVIPRDTPNGEYETQGVITYQAQERVHSVSPYTLTFPIDELGQVVVHTPVVCDAYASDERAYNQMIAPDKTVSSLVLGREFYVSIPTEGGHLAIEGYGYRDYSKYTDQREICFPFDVYQEDRFYKAGTWIRVNNDRTAFLLPIWVTEGHYLIECRSISISAFANGADDREEVLANLDRQNYVATCQVPVEVSGRIYGFRITDITDYPTWRNVFRQPGSLMHSGTYYSIGDRDKDGKLVSRERILQVPLLTGSHPTITDAGITPTGYAFRFTLETIGEFYDDDDYVQLTPQFFYIDVLTRKRVEADVYYCETFDSGKHALVKIGSEHDLRNVKMRYLGNPYYSVSEEEWREKTRLTGESLYSLKYRTEKMFTFHHVTLSEAFRTYIGKNCAPEGKVPSTVNERKVAMSKQRWYGEYYLPSQVYAVPKGFDLQQYERQKGGFNFREDIWLKNGYLLIQFDVKAIRNNQTYLSLCNLDNEKEGYCNMWRKEGFSYERTDGKGQQWKFTDGDTFLYDTRKSVGLDYVPGGTH